MMNISTNTKIYLAVIVMLLCLQHACGMKTSKLFKFPKDEDYVYVGKFSVGEDKYANFNIRAGFSSALEGDMIKQEFSFFYVIVRDTDWPEFMKTDDWSRRAGLAEIFQSVIVKGDGYWSSVGTHTFINKRRTHVYYAAALNWHRGMHPEMPYLPKIWMEVKAFNGGEHFSQEEWGVLTMNFIMFFTFIFFLGYSAYGYLKEIRKEGSWGTPLGILAVALLFEFFQILLNLLHLSVYEFDGEGIPGLDILSTIFQVISQVFIVTLLLLLAYGWTVTYQHLPDKDAVILLTCLILLFHIIVAGFTYLDKDEHHKFHDYSGIQGFILVILRLMLFAAFVYGIKLSSSDIKKKQRGFLRLLAMAGSFYILAFPILYFISYICDQYVRSRVIVFGHFILQTIAWTLLLFQLSAKGSKYKNASMKTIFGM